MSIIYWFQFWILAVQSLNIIKIVRFSKKVALIFFFCILRSKFMCNFVIERFYLQVLPTSLLTKKNKTPRPSITTSYFQTRYRTCPCGSVHTFMYSFTYIWRLLSVSGYVSVYVLLGRKRTYPKIHFETHFRTIFFFLLDFCLLGSYVIHVCT